MVAREDLTKDAELLNQLLLARRGTAFFARQLNQLPDAGLDGCSLLPGWTRRHVIAHVGYNARAIARLVEWARTGIEMPMYDSIDARDTEINFGATLSPIALRHLFDHSAVHLNVEWRDLEPSSWLTEVKTIQGREIMASETVWMRTREVWLHAIDLDNGATFSQVPLAVLSRLLKDITDAWSARGSDVGLVVEVVGSDGTAQFGDVARPLAQVSGSLVDVAEWASGRGGAAVRARLGTEFPAPRWI